jgi:integrase
MPTKPRIPAYLRLSRHGIYYFRVVVPRDLRPRWSGRLEIKLSLQTRDVRQALTRARDFAIAAHKSFEYARANMSAKPYDPKAFNPRDPSTWPKAGDGRNFEKTIETVHTSEGFVERVKYKVDPESPADIAAARADEALHYKRQQMLRQPNSPEAEAFFQAQDEELRRSLLAEAELAEMRRKAERTQLEAKMMAAAQGAQAPAVPAAAQPLQTTAHTVVAAGAARLSQGDAEIDLGQRLRRSAEAQKQFDKHKLSALWGRHLAIKKKEWAVKRPPKKDKDGKEAKDKTADTYQMKFDTFIDWFGDTHIEDVTIEDISEYKDHLLHDVVVRGGRKNGQKGLDLPTVDNYVGVLNGMFDWAQRNGMFPRQMLLPTSKQRLMTKAMKKGRAQSGRVNRAFKFEELVKAFDPKNYRVKNCLSHHYWPPLIALFTGMRLGEVSQLACSDIRMEEGIWTIDINDEEYKKVKSAAARRLIPMHPELVALGLPQFMQDVKSLDLGPQLFPVLRPTSNGTLGNAPGKKWDLYLKAVGLVDDALTYHSFRRTANTLLKRAKVPFDVRCQMVGHDLDHVNEFYATEYSVSDLAELVLPKFVFPGLDLSGLRYERGQFNEAIRSGYESVLAEERERKKAGQE